MRYVCVCMCVWTLLLVATAVPCKYTLLAISSFAASHTTLALMPLYCGEQIYSYKTNIKTEVTWHRAL